MSDGRARGKGSSFLWLATGWIAASLALASAPASAHSFLVDANPSS